MGNEAATPDREGFVPHDHLTVCGTVTASPAFVARLGRCNWLRNKLYNAATDDRVPFEEGFAYRLAESEARRNGTSVPAAPKGTTAYQPIPDYRDLRERFGVLAEAHPALKAFVPSLFLTALDEACEARAENVKRIVQALAEGKKRPRLSRRSADDAWCVVTDSFTIRRTGDGKAAQPEKRRFKSPEDAVKAGRNKHRREKRKVRKDDRKAQARLDAGWSEEKVQLWLWARLLRAERCREENASYDRLRKQAALPEKGRPRSDSPLAHVGQRRLNVQVVGLGVVRANVDRPIPAGAEVVRVTFLKRPGHGAKVEVRLTIRFPRVEPVDADGKPLPTEADHGLAMHRALRHLPPNADSLTIVETLRKADFNARAVDLNNGNPTVDDRNERTAPVRIDRAELKKMEGMQRRLAHKDACREELGKEELRKEGMAAKAAKGEVVAEPEPTEAEKADVKRRRRKRSGKAEKLRGEIARAGDKARRRQQTRACQNASHAMRGGIRMLAIDPKRMVKSLIAKGGPAERRAKRKAGEEAKVEGTVQPQAVPAPAAGTAAMGDAPAKRSFVMTPKKQRAQRRNAHATRYATVIRQTERIARRRNVLWLTPGHEHTSSDCPKCGRRERKALGVRVHDCPCGLVMPRDQAGAIETFGKAARPFILSPDPGGMIAARAAKAAEALAKGRLAWERARAAGAKGAAVRTANRRKKAGSSPGIEGVDSLGPREGAEPQAKVDRDG